METPGDRTHGAAVRGMRARNVLVYVNEMESTKGHTFEYEATKNLVASKRFVNVVMPGDALAMINV